MKGVQLRILVAEPSAIIRAGVASVLQGIDTVHAHVYEVSEPDELRQSLAAHKPDVLIVNPLMAAVFSLQQLRRDAPQNMKAVALHSSDATPLLSAYDESISLYEQPAQIAAKLQKLVSAGPEQPRHEPLSAREKQVLSCVVRGMTNKQIADKLCLSAHTVTTHRRNISAKLDIHSAAGLTIYAIVNKIVGIDDLGTQAE